MLSLESIGIIRSAFPEKFGVPKQPGLAPALQAVLELRGDWAHETCLRGLEQCSHLWVIFHFHLSGPFHGGTVRPPVLGGEKRMGVFATRTPHRPNPIGLSLVKIEEIRMKPGLAHIHVSGHDFVDQTPLLDIKPYVSSYDEPSTPAHHWSQDIVQPALEIVWRGQALLMLEQLGQLKDKAALDQVLALDPRPRGAKPDAKFGMSFAGLNVVFSVENDLVMIEEVSRTGTSSHIK